MSMFLSSCQNGSSPLHLSAEKGHTNTCALLLDRGADLNPKDNVSVTGERKWLWEGVHVGEGGGGYFFCGFSSF